MDVFIWPDSGVTRTDMPIFGLSQSDSRILEKSISQKKFEIS